MIECDECGSEYPFGFGKKGAVSSAVKSLTTTKLPLIGVFSDA